MGWLRSHRGKVAWLAFFALACQFVFTFGHVHLGNVRVNPAALAILVDATDDSSRDLPPPAQKSPIGLAQDFCAVCNNIGLASTLVVPASPATFPPVSFVHAPHWPLVAIERASADHVHFDARGPPHA
jgi:hypothetical protein